MTATELQRIANRLSNQSWCRYWMNFFDRKTDVLMAIQILENVSGTPQPVPCTDLLRLGFCEWAEYPDHIYFIARTNEDGTPYVSEVF